MNYRDVDWRKLVCTLIRREDMTMVRIAKECDVSTNTIRWWRDGNGLPCKDNKIALREFLQREGIDIVQFMTLTQPAKPIHPDTTALVDRLQGYSMKEQQHLAGLVGSILDSYTGIVTLSKEGFRE